ENGADAIYLGMNKFNARAKAGNFSFEELKKAIEYCHKNGVKVYVTLNTLIKNNEIEEFFQTIEQAYISGADAIIIQELSFASQIKKTFPDLEVHASTQARIHNLKELKNVDRVILPRELNKKEIEEISKIGMPIEIFVQGALCFCVSGLCLMSSFIGGRSGNRGMCAQPCRKKYNDEYLMSMKDLSLISKIKELNVASLKVEGRLRNKKYVETVTKLYRKALDEGFNEKDLACLKGVFNRELTEGFYSNCEKKTSPHNLKFEEIDFNYKYVNNKQEIKVERERKKLVITKIKEKIASEPGFYVKVNTLKGVREGCEFSRVKTIFYYADNKDVLEAKQICKDNNKKFYLTLPTIVNDKEIEDYIKKVKEINPDGVLINSFGFKNKFDNCITDYGMNVFNDYDLNFYGKSIISPELNFDELTHFKNKDFLVLVHGNITVMTTKNKLPGMIKDDKGYKFIVEKEKDYYKILNSKQIALLDEVLELKKSGITQFYFDLTSNVKKWLDIYSRILEGEKINTKKIGKGHTKGHYERGIN
ncbi:hypothetical protein HN662_05000, partial [Candidatus Woesearchaeota archaeon]|nr:hypothetical protein [Candidatus Woesearchaeota archaeon]